MQDFRILDGGAGSELQDLGFHVNVSIYLRKVAWLDPHETSQRTKMQRKTFIFKLWRMENLCALFIALLVNL